MGKSITTASLTLILCLILALPDTGALQAQFSPEGDRTYDPDFFPFSVWYSGGTARAPMLSEITPESEEEWREDLRTIRELGFNTVRTWVEWAKAEPVEGEYDLENLELLLRLAEEQGLRVFIQYYVDSAPDWVSRKYPHTRFVAQDGTAIPSQAAPGYCTDNPEIHEAVMGFYREVSQLASRHDNFYGWDLWSEPHIINWANIDYIPNAQFCYCQATQAAFREWLRDKYGSLEALNRAWYRGFQEWEDVEPPRFSTILSYTDYIDWKSFIHERLGRDLADRYDAVREGGSDHVITSHAAVSSIITSPHMGVGAPDDFLMARAVDFYGTSLYPKHNRPTRHWPWWRLTSMMDFQRSANRHNDGWYVGELQAGDGTIALLLSEPVRPEDHRVWAWSAIAKGARAINIYAFYPMSTGYEAGGYGLINLDGTVTERARRAGELAATVDRNQQTLLNARPTPSRVGIVYNPLAQMVGGAQRRQDFPEAHQHSLLGYYRVFAEENIPVDFIHREELEAGEVNDYDLIIVPYPIMLTEAASSGIREFVRSGGYAVAEARLAWNDERGFASEVIPGDGLHEVFGLREDEVWMLDGEDGFVDITGSAHPVLSRLEEGSRIRGRLHASNVEPISDETEVLGTIDGRPSIVASRYGEGQTLFIGTYAGFGNHPEADDETSRFILGIAEWAGIDRPVTAEPRERAEKPLIARLHEIEGGGSLLFVINHDDSEQSADLAVRVHRAGEYELREWITGRRQTSRPENGRLRMETRLERKGVEVWEIRPR